MSVFAALVLIFNAENLLCIQSSLIFSLSIAGMAVSASCCIEFQDYKHQMLCSDSEALTVQQYLEFPTPPLSPDHEDKQACLSTPNPLLPELPVPTDNSPLMPQLDVDAVFQLTTGLGPDYLFDINPTTYNDDASDVVDLDPSVLSLISKDTKALLQDCMWNSVTYEPRHSISGSNSSPEMYTPAPSPLPETKEPIEDDEEDDDSCSDLSSEPSQLGDDLISPSEVFAYGAAILANPNCRPLQQEEQQQQREHQARLSRKAEREERRASGSRRAVAGGRSRVQPRTVASESGNYILSTFCPRVCQVITFFPCAVNFFTFKVFHYLQL